MADKKKPNYASKLKDEAAALAPAALTGVTPAPLTAAARHGVRCSEKAGKRMDGSEVEARGPRRGPRGITALFRAAGDGRRAGNGDCDAVVPDLFCPSPDA